MLKLRRLDRTAAGFYDDLERLLAWESTSDAEINRRVRAILDDVRARGDEALIEYTRRFDRLGVDRAGALEMPRARLEQALATIPADKRAAIEHAAQRVRAYHEHQKVESWSYTEPDGTLLGQQVTPLDRVGLYVPGGKAAYPSTVIMNAIPAKVAGVPELIMVVPAPEGIVDDLVLAAALVAGVDRVFTIGGAQAVAALAWGTATVPRVDKIVGPGNIYVATAKGMVYGTVGIDMIAGPSEILVVSDGRTPADWIAMDLFSQAEHDEDAQSILVSPDAAHLDAVEASIARLLPQMERRDIIEASMSRRAALIRVRDLDEAVEVVNFVAPEHLELSVEDPQALARKVRHAGAIFLGRHTAEAIGDYVAGPNHVLPTSRTARFSSPLGVYDFQKRSSLIMCTAEGAAALGETAALLARSEGLTAHARSAEYRIGRTEGKQGMGKHDKAQTADASAVERWVRPEIRALSAYHVPSSEGLIKLDAMENPYRWPQAMLDDWGAALREVSLNRYPDPAPQALITALRAYAGVPDGAGIVLGNGSDELIQMMALAVAGPGRALIAPEPSFSMYRMIALFAGLEFIGVPLRAGDFSLDTDAMVAAIERHRPALVFIDYPNNPTGRLFEPSALRRVIEAAPGAVIVDEAYHAFAGASVMSWLDEYPDLLVMRTLSKAGLAGLRLGLVAGSAAWTREIDKVRLPYNVNILTQASARFALEHRAVLEEQAARIRADRERLYGALSALPGLEVWPSSANFILFRLAAGRGEPVFAGLRARGVLVKHLGAVPGLQDCLRVTVGTPEENAAFIEALRAEL